jgi:signal transduction histidine kinase
MHNLFSLLRRLFFHLRVRLLLLVILTCAPLVVLTLNTSWEERRRQTVNWERQGARLVQVAEIEEERLIANTRQLLSAIAESGPVRAGDAKSSANLLAQLFGSDRRYANLGVLKTNGEVLATAVELSAQADMAHSEVFRKVIEFRTFSVAASNVRASSAAGSVNFGAPVFDTNGQLQGIVFASLDLDWINNFGSQLPGQLPKGAIWKEVDRNGIVAVGYPPGPGEAPGSSLLEKELLKSLQAGRAGVVQMEDHTGSAWLFSVHPMQSQLVSGSLFAILGIPRYILFATADSALHRDLGWLLLSTLLAIAIGWIGSNYLVIRPVKAMVDSSARLAAGDFSARTGLRHGPDELGRLTLAFDLMAQALEQRELERKRATQKLQVLSHRLVGVQENERRHIARELHDEIGQSLTVAEMNLQAALQEAGPASHKRLEDSMEAVNRVATQVHDLSLNLRPSMLDDLGLEPALRWYTQRQAALIGIKGSFKGDELERRLDPVVETECFRVAQEALSNVVKHSRATSLEVELRRDEGHLHVTVKDNGKGFDVKGLRNSAVEGASLGLLSMEERAGLAGGGLEYNSAPGKGTEVHAWFPLKWLAEQS